MNCIIGLSRIRPNPFEPVTRLNPDPNYIEELAADIRQNGLLQLPAGRLLLDGEIQAIADRGSRRPGQLALRAPRCRCPVGLWTSPSRGIPISRRTWICLRCYSLHPGQIQRRGNGPIVMR